MSFFFKIFGGSNTTPVAPVVPPKKNVGKRGDLHRVASTSMTTLSQIQDVKGRSKTLRQFGLQILKDE